MCTESAYYEKWVRFVQDSICAAFNASRQYANTFEVFLRFYRDNESLDLDKVRTDEHGKRLRSNRYKSAAVAEMGDRLATINVDQKVGGGCRTPFCVGEGAGYPI